jgi:hypothetical protein
MMINLKRLHHGPFNIPVAKSPPHNLLANSQFFCPLNARLGYSVIGNIHVISGVSSLLFTRGPSAIIGRIVTIIINSINRIFAGQSFPHIGIKVFKGVSPAITNSNTSSTITRIIRIIRIGTTIDKSSPYSIFGAFPHSMFCIEVPGIFFLPTSTTCRCTPKQTRLHDISFCTAETATIPLGMTRSGSGIIDNSPSTEGFSNKIIFGFIHYLYLALDELYHKKRGKDRRYELPYWGKFAEVMA